MKKLILLLLILFLFSCGRDPGIESLERIALENYHPSTPPVQAPINIGDSEAPSINDLIFDSCTQRVSPGRMFVLATGSLTNKSTTKTYNDVIILVDLMDRYNHVLDTNFIYIDIGPKEQASFEVTLDNVLDWDFIRCKIDIGDVEVN